MHDRVRPRSTTTARRRLSVAVAVVLVAAVLAGLVGTIAGDPGGDAAAERSPGGAAAAPAAPAGVVAVDYAFEGLPERAPAGTELTLFNSSTAEAHELVAVRLADDDERTVDELVELPADELAAVFADPAARLVAGPGGGEGVTVAGDPVLDERGRYAVFCLLPIGGDPDAAVAGEPLAGGLTHARAGMYGQLVVTR